MRIRKIKSLKILLPAAVALVAVVVGSYAWLHNPKPDGTTQPRPTNQVNYSPPTQAEQQSGNQQKQKDVARDKLNQTSAPSKTASVVVVDGHQYGDIVEVRAFIDNLFESGGTCTATFTKSGSPTVAQSSSASPGATTTNCQTIDIPRAKFDTAGSWQLVVTYRSGDAAGTAQAQRVIVQ